MTLTLAYPTLPTTESAPTRTTALPPLGPAWFPAVMGTGILGTLLQTYAGRLPWGHAAAVVALVVAWTVLVLLAGGFLLRIARDREAFTATVRDVDKVPMWGTVAMGLLAVGSSTATVVPATWPGLTGAAWAVDGVLWRLFVVDRGGSLTQGLVALRWDGCCDTSAQRTRTTSCDRAYVLAA